MTEKENTPLPDSQASERPTRPSGAGQPAQSSGGLLVAFIAILGLVILYGIFSK
jgi:hypothetical protein